LEIIDSGIIPAEILDYLGIKHTEAKDEFNRAFLNRIIYDVIDTSDNKELIGISDDGFDIIKKINRFSEDNIYTAKKVKNYQYYVGVILNNIYVSLLEIFEKYGSEFENYNKCFIDSYKIFGHWLETYEQFFKETEADKIQILIDYISGMSDNFAINFHRDISVPKSKFNWRPQ